jgi:hypothetical protein
MGDYVLMKNFILLPLILTSLAAITNEDLSWVDKQVQAIKPPRDGESLSSISRIKDPFIFLKKDSSKSSKKSPASTSKSMTNSGALTSKAPVVFTKNSLVLGAIINKVALINGNWYKVGERVNGYKVHSISRKSVTLKNGSKTKLLTTASKNKKLKFKGR